MIYVLDPASQGRRYLMTPQRRAAEIAEHTHALRMSAGARLACARGLVIRQERREANARIGLGIARAWASHIATHPRQTGRDLGPVTNEGLLAEAIEISERWTYPDYVHLEVVDADNWILLLSTGGWSENEEIIDNVSVMFRMTRWLASRRGGHHVFGCGALGDAGWEQARVEIPIGQGRDCSPEAL